MTQDTKAQLVSAAAELLDSGGQAAVTLRAVAQKVGVSHNAPYRHFHDRSALLGGVAERDFKHLKAVFDAANASDIGPRAALHDSCAALVNYALTHKARYRLLFTDPGLPNSQTIKDAAFASFEAFDRIVSRCQKEGLLSTHKVRLTGLIYAAVHGAIDLEIGGRASSAKGLGSVDATVDLLLDLLSR